MVLATPLVQLAGRLLWHSLHPTPAALYQVIVTWWPVPEGDLTLKAYCSVVSFLPDLAFCDGTDKADEHVCLLFSCYSNAFVFAPVAHVLEVPV